MRITPEICRGCGSFSRKVGDMWCEASVAERCAVMRAPDSFVISGVDGWLRECDYASRNIPAFCHRLEQQECAAMVREL